jgi:hypothetical protein
MSDEKMRPREAIYHAVRRKKSMQTPGNHVLATHVSLLPLD